MCYALAGISGKPNRVRLRQPRKYEDNKLIIITACVYRVKSITFKPGASRSCKTWARYACLLTQLRRVLNETAWRLNVSTCPKVAPQSLIASIPVKVKVYTYIAPQAAYTATAATLCHVRL